MRTLTFEMISDSRFDGQNFREVGKERNDRVRELLGNIDGVELEYDRALRYEFPTCEQVRQRFYVKKTTRKLTWNDIMRIVNSVEAVPYTWR